MRECELLFFIGEYIDNEELCQELEGGEVLNISMGDDDKRLSITVRFDRYVSCDIIKSAEKAVKDSLGIDKVNIDVKFGYNIF